MGLRFQIAIPNGGNIFKLFGLAGSEFIYPANLQPRLVTALQSRGDHIPNERNGETQADQPGRSPRDPLKEFPARADRSRETGSNFAFRLLNGHHFSLLSDSSQPAARRSIHQRAARRQWDFFGTDTAGRG